jgi:hypothetical protein
MCQATTENMPVAKSERFSQRQGIARTVMLVPGHTARVFEVRRGTGVLTLGSGVLPVCASVRTRVNSRQERSDLSEHRIQPPAHQFLQGPRYRWAQFPEGVGSSRPLVSLTSGAGGASSPAIAGVISAGTEATVAAGLAGW